jgi:hypothetical protein
MHLGISYSVKTAYAVMASDIWYRPFVVFLPPPAIIC